MAYGKVLADTIQSSTANVPPQFNDGNGTQTGTLCRAWVNFNGTGTVAIRASFNVSSITDNGTGMYTVNLTAAMPDTNYSIVLGGQELGTSNTPICVIRSDVTITTSVFGVATYTGASRNDFSIVNAAVFR